MPFCLSFQFFPVISARERWRGSVRAVRVRVCDQASLRVPAPHVLAIFVPARAHAGSVSGGTTLLLAVEAVVMHKYSVGGWVGGWVGGPIPLTHMHSHSHAHALALTLTRTRTHTHTRSHPHVHALACASVGTGASVPPLPRIGADETGGDG